jgi:hypothetical protein
MLAVQVLSDDGLGSFGTIIQAMDWVMKKSASRGKPSIITLSLTGSFYQPMNDMVTARRRW